MCSSLRHLERDRKKMPLDKINQQQWNNAGGMFRLILADATNKVARWDGHAREETLKATWLDKGWKRCDIHVDGYTEGYFEREYDVPLSYALQGVTKILPNVGQVFRIITRRSRGKELDVQPRFPKMEKKRY